VLFRSLCVSTGAFLTGNGTRASIQAGMSQAQIGEFAFIIAGLGATLGTTRDFIYPVAATVSAITTLTTPWLIRASGPLASFVDRKLPKRLQTFASLYASWVERLGSAGRREETTGTRLRGYLKRAIGDAILVAAVIIGVALERAELVAWLRRTLGLDPVLATVLLMAVATVVAAPFVLGLARLARRIGVVLARAALPAGRDGTVDLSAAPRRALVLTLEIAAVLVVGAPLVALTQPFLPGVPGAVILSVGIAALALAFWRSAANLDGHVRAGAEVIVESLRAHARGPEPEPAPETLSELLPGLGAPVPFRLRADSASVGRTLAELDVRGLTGATVLAIIRGDEGVTVPTARERLRDGDVLALAGTEEAVAAATRLLANGREPEAPVT